MGHNSELLHGPPRTVSDVELAKRALQGDPNAQEELTRRFRPLVQRIIGKKMWEWGIHKLDCAITADDLTEEIVAKLLGYKRNGELMSKIPLEKWLHDPKGRPLQAYVAKIAINECKDILEKLIRRSRGLRFVNVSDENRLSRNQVDASSEVEEKIRVAMQQCISLRRQELAGDPVKLRVFELQMQGCETQEICSRIRQEFSQERAWGTIDNERSKNREALRRLFKERFSDLLKQARMCGII